MIQLGLLECLISLASPLALMSFLVRPATCSSQKKDQKTEMHLVSEGDRPRTLLGLSERTNSKETLVLMKKKKEQVEERKRGGSPCGTGEEKSR